MLLCTLIPTAHSLFQSAPVDTTCLLRVAYSDSSGSRLWPLTCNWLLCSVVIQLFFYCYSLTCFLLGFNAVRASTLNQISTWALYK